MQSVLNDLTSIVINAPPSILYAAAAGVAIISLGSHQRRRRKKRFDHHKHHIGKSNVVLDRLIGEGRWQSKIAYLRTIHPSTLEEMLLTALERAGYRIKRNKRYTGDGGLDGRFWLPNGKKMLIQAKRYQASVSSQHIDDFGRLCEERGVTGLFIHTGKTPKVSWNGLAAKPLVIISGPRLIQFLTDPAATLRDMKVE
jgi:restriction system protein